MALRSMLEHPPGAERAVSLAGLLTDSFEEAAEKVLPELSGLHLAETTVQRTTEAAGAGAGDLDAASAAIILNQFLNQQS